MHHWCTFSFSELAGWLVSDESAMPALHLGSQRGQSSANQELLFVQTGLPDGRKALFNQMWGLLCPATFRDKLLFVFDKPGHSCSLTGPDLWRSPCLDGQPMLSHYLFCLSGPCLLCHSCFISRYILHLQPFIFIFFGSLLIDVLQSSVLHRSDCCMRAHIQRQERNINHGLRSLYLKC